MRQGRSRRTSCNTGALCSVCAHGSGERTWDGERRQPFYSNSSECLVAFLAAQAAAKECAALEDGILLHASSSASDGRGGVPSAHSSSSGGGGGGGSVLLDIINVMKSSNGSAGGGKSQQQLGLNVVWESIEALPPIEQLEFSSRTKTLHEYELLQVLGTGQFAEVQACRARADGKAASPVFAIKHISKAHIVSVSNMKRTLRRIKRVGTEIAVMGILSSTCVRRRRRFIPAVAVPARAPPRACPRTEKTRRVGCQIVRACEPRRRALVVVSASLHVVVFRPSDRDGARVVFCSFPSSVGRALGLVAWLGLSALSST